MIIPQLLVFLALIAVFGLAAWAVFVSVPKSLLSLFRYKLWRVRDAIADDMAEGRLPQIPAVRFFKDYTEVAIWLSDRMTFLWFIVGCRHSDGVERALSEKFDEADAQMSPEQAQRFRAYRKAVSTAITTHLVIGSPSGWIALLLALVGFTIAFPVILVRKLLRHSSLSLQRMSDECFGYAQPRIEEKLTISRTDRPLKKCEPLSACAG